MNFDNFTREELITLLNAMISYQVDIEASIRSINESLQQHEEQLSLLKAAQEHRESQEVTVLHQVALELSGGSTIFPN